MPEHEFTAYLDRQPTDDELDALYEAGFDDSVIEVGQGRGMIHITRQAPTLTDAIVSVVEGASRAGFTVVGLADEDLVPLRTVAQRVGRSYESLRLYATGKMGPGDFPPVSGGDGWTLVSWAAASAWCRERLGIDLPDDERGRTLAAADHLLRAAALGVDLGPLTALTTPHAA